MKKLNFLLMAGCALCIFVGLSCGPEAETGAVFTKYGAQPCAAVSPADMPKPDTSKQPDRTQLDELMGKFDPTKHADFVPVKSPYSDRQGMYLRQATATAFQKMWQAAKADGIKLNIISSTRNFDYQKNIWEKKWMKLAAQFPDSKTRALKILEYSAMPGASRHHWGTDIDLNDLNNATFNSGGAQEKVYVWLQKHASEYGFFQPYTPKGADRPNGYNEEKWHWSYRPLADPLLRQYEQSITDQMISGFSGAETAPDIGIVKHYVSGIAQNK